MSRTEHPEVFISYSWDSDKHKNLILTLANRLREEDGINCDIDQYHIAPPSGWPSWMETNILRAKYVLIVCTERYYKRYMNEEPIGTGKGVKWESLLTKNYLASVDSQNTKFIPIVYGHENSKYIPPSLKGSTLYDLSLDADYKLLVRHITEQPLVKKPLLGTKKVLPPKNIKSVDNSEKDIKQNLVTQKTPNLKKPFNVPFESKKKGAIGIGTKLLEVHTALQDETSHRANIGQVATFQGMGGLGKTQLAVEYAHAYKDEYEGVVWLTVDQDIDRQIVELAESVGWVAKEVDAKVKLDIAKSKYADLENMLLIYDNVENYEQNVVPLLPRKNNNKILITSRSFISGFTSVELTTLNQENSLELLAYESQRPIEDSEKESVDKLIEELDGLPLAIEMAGAYMLDADLTWNEYWQLFLKQNVSFLEKSPLRGSGTRHENNISKTLAIGEQIFDTTPLLKEIIHLLAFGASEPMSKELLSQMLGVEEFEVAEAIQEGTRLKYIKKEDEDVGVLYTLHRLVREVWKSQRELDEQFIKKVSENLAAYLKDIKDEFLNLKKLEMASFQAKNWAIITENINIKALLLSYAAYPNYYMGDYKNALVLVEESYTIVDKEIDSAEYAEVLTYKKSLIQSLGDARKALPYCEEALEIRKRLYPESDHPDVANSLNSMGGVLQSLGDARKALPYCEEALEMRKRLYPESDHPDVANSLNSMGFILDSLGDARKALPYYEEALEMRKRLYPESDHPNIANSLNNMGFVLDSLGDARKALQYYEEALEMERRLYPESDHPNIANSLNNMGGVLQSFGDARKALQYYEEALEMERRLYPESDHPNIANSLNNMGFALHSLGDARKALQYYEETLEMEKRLYPESDHPNIANSLNNMGFVLQSLGDARKALPYYEEALEMGRRLYPESDHPNIANSLNNMGGVLRSLGDARKALPYYEEALEMRKRLYPESDHPDIANSLNNVGVILVHFKQCRQAHKYLLEAKEMMERLGYDQSTLSTINGHLRRVEKLMEKERKVSFKKKGKYCQHMGIR